MIIHNSHPSKNSDIDIESISQELWEDLYYSKKEGWLTILSGSMYPLMKIKAKILVKPVSLECIKIGDIILFKNKKMLIAHWVIGVKNKNGKISFLQQGNNYNTSSYVDGTVVLGKVFEIKNKDRIIKLDKKSRRFNNYIMVIYFRIVYELIQIIKKTYNLIRNS